MSENHIEPNTIIVTGDVMMDWNITTTLPAEKRKKGWSGQGNTQTSWQRGGTALLADLLIEVTQRQTFQEGPWQVRQTGAPTCTVAPNDPHFYHSFAIWDQKAASPGSRDRVWRVDDFLGIHEGEKSLKEWMHIQQDDENARVIVLDDAAMYFREQEDLFPRALDSPTHQPWILYKASKDLFTGKLWNLLISAHSQRLIVLVGIEDLRRLGSKSGEHTLDGPLAGGMQISRELSWDDTVQDLIWELNYNPGISSLANCAYLIVSFGASGALLVQRDQTSLKSSLEAQCTLYFDHKYIEGSWEDQFDGQIMGSHTCLAAGIVRHLMQNQEKPDFDQGIQSGIAAMRRLRQTGYEMVETPDCGRQLRFPFRIIAEELAKSEISLLSKVVVDPPVEIEPPETAEQNHAVRSEAYWTILEEVGNSLTGKTQSPEELSIHLSGLACKVILEGIEISLPNVPIGQFEKLVTVDRKEIESYRSIRISIDEYCNKDNVEQPLSLAVFGAPGSGKSFGIKQLAGSVSGKIEAITFNLSQFNTENDLKGAFHQVRDLVLGGKIPLVFWDEFDTQFQDQPLGWLRFFLAPMQDGKFQDGQVTHPIGRSIFVFAGGTCQSMDQFREEEHSDKERQVYKNAKKPDFISRLKGFINIMGPNPRNIEELDHQAASRKDPYYIIRRAVLIRKLFERCTPELFTAKVLQIDPGVLYAILHVRMYLHGARSIQSLIDMSTLIGKKYFDRSSLPQEAQLKLHVSDDFIDLLYKNTLSQADQVERIARAVHEAYCRERLRGGYRYGKITDTKEKTLDNLLNYDDPDLAEKYREESRANAVDIIAKLERLGYRIRQSRSSLIRREFSDGEDIETLAKWEHLRYMKGRLKQDWRWAPETRRENRENKTLLLWGPRNDEELAEDFKPEFTLEEVKEMQKNQIIGPGYLLDEDKDIDRELVRAIPVILASAGYSVEKIDKTRAAGS
jgi:hypothetical protein